MVTELLNYDSDLRQFNELPVEYFVVGAARTAFEAYIFSGGKKDTAYMREQADAVRFIQERYAWFLTEAFQRRAFEKKKGQRKLPLAQQIYEKGRFSGVVDGVRAAPGRGPVSV